MVIALAHQMMIAIQSVKLVQSGRTKAMDEKRLTDGCGPLDSDVPQDDNRYQHFSIELDCPPGNPRPEHLIGCVLSGTGLKVEDFDTSPPFFGHQTWILKPGNEDKDALFNIHKRGVFKVRIEYLYHRGLIRYGTW
jgi:hypothetical protein